MNRSRLRKIRLATAAMFIAGGILMSVLTYNVLEDFAGGQITPRLILTVLADFLLILAFSAFLFQEFARRSAKAQGTGIAAPLQVRLSGVFALGALVPTVIVASTGTLAFGIGLGDWLATEVRSELSEAANAADSYYSGELKEMEQTLVELAQTINAEYLSNPELGSGSLRQSLQRAHKALQGNLETVFVIQSDCSIAARGLSSYKYNYDPPPVGIMKILAPTADFAGAECGGEVPESQTYLDSDGSNSLVIYRSKGRTALLGVAIIKNAHNRFIAASKSVDTPMLALYDSIEVRKGTSGETVQKLGNRIFLYSVGALAGALLLIFAMVRFGIWYSARISKPVTELAAAADKVGQGQLDEKLRISGNDEIAILGQNFNKMTERLSAQQSRLNRQYTQLNDQNEQLNRQNEQLTVQREQAQRRERTFRSVLSSVTPGVIGLDEDTTIMFMNRSASQILAVEENRFNADSDRYEQIKLGEISPEIGDLLGKFESSESDIVQEKIVLERYGYNLQLLVRCATRRNISGAVEGFVVAVDDVTDQVNAERKAAWSDVAQRIAHEVKNPLTPILLAGAQLQETIGPKLDEPDRAYLDDKVGNINSNVDRLARLTGEFRQFSSFSNVKLRSEDITGLIEEVVFIERSRGSGIVFSTKFSQRPIFLQIDRDYLLQVLENLLKNAREAIAEKREALGQNAFTGQIRIEATCSGGSAVINVIDNGVGFKANRDKLLEPYSSTKKKRERESRGLGLPNVLQVIDGHGGQLELLDAPAFEGCDYRGAHVRIVLPIKQTGAENVGS